VDLPGWGIRWLAKSSTILFGSELAFHCFDDLDFTGQWLNGGRRRNGEAKWPHGSYETKRQD